ncbi:AcrR family transcriptional regulator [Bradyrhizobium diazoefficiens]
MADRRSRSISSRKQPQQARSTGLVAAILDAAVQVLAKEGAQRFTTARVAERAGVSVGSLYQYFPNKAAILFRLQRDEWQRTSELLRGILADRAKPPSARLRALVHAFIRSECEEAAIRTALSDAAPLYRDAPEAHDARAAGKGIVATFMAGGAAQGIGCDARSRRRTDHDDAERGRQALLGDAAQRGGDRAPCRGARRHVLRLSRRAGTAPRSFLTSAFAPQYRFGFRRMMR